MRALRAQPRPTELRVEGYVRVAQDERADPIAEQGEGRDGDRIADEHQRHGERQIATQRQREQRGDEQLSRHGDECREQSETECQGNRASVEVKEVGILAAKPDPAQTTVAEHRMDIGQFAFEEAFRHGRDPGRDRHYPELAWVRPAPE